MAEFVAVSGAGYLGEGEMRAFDVRGTKIALANVGARSMPLATRVRTWRVR